MERSAEERTKYPDRINLDRRGLHGIPLLADEPGLRLLRFLTLFYSQGLCCIPLLTDEPDFRLLLSPTFFPFRVFTPSDIFSQ